MIGLAVVLALQVHAAPTIGDHLAPFTLTKRDRSLYSWSPGRATVLTFCAFWCDTWKAQLPQVKLARAALEGLPIDFATVSVDGRWTEQGGDAAVGETLSDAGMRWTSKIGIDRVPYTLVIDAEGVVRWALSGEVSARRIVNEARKALKPLVDGGVVYLTFDDFPAASGDDELLDVLRAKGVKATFFCVCSRVDASAALVRRSVADGNRLEIHAWVHGEPKTDLARCSETLSRFGPVPHLFRPSGKESVLDLWGQSLPLRDLNAYDYARPGPAELFRRVTHQVANGMMIQLHAGTRDTRQALSGIIDNLSGRGFRFELLPDSAEKLESRRLLR